MGDPFWAAGPHDRVAVEFPGLAETAEGAPGELGAIATVGPDGAGAGVGAGGAGGAGAGVGAG